MLVLSRKVGQRIVIGDSIQLVVVAVQGNRVKLGIEAPDGMSIHRAEVFARIAREFNESVSTSAGVERELDADSRPTVRSATLVPQLDSQSPTIPLPLE